MLENAVMRMTGRSGLRSLTFRNTDNPSPSGSLKSRRIRSISSLALSIPSAAVPASTTSCPSAVSRSRSDQRTSCSSSTTRIRENAMTAKYSGAVVSGRRALTVHAGTHLAGLALALLAFAAQRQTPSSPAIGGLYALPILLGPWTAWRHYTPVATAVSIALAAAGSVEFGRATPEALSGETFPMLVALALIGVVIGR